MDKCSGKVCRKLIFILGTVYFAYILGGSTEQYFLLKKKYGPRVAWKSKAPAFLLLFRQLDVTWEKLDLRALHHPSVHQLVCGKGVTPTK